MTRRRTTLPIDEYEILEKDLSGRRKGGVHRPARKGSRGSRRQVEQAIVGLHLPDKGEIWVDRNLPPSEKAFTLLHELVHARRSLSEEEHEDQEIDELMTELEAIARAPEETLTGLFLSRLLLTLKAFLTRDHHLEPDREIDLAQIQARAEVLVAALGKMGGNGGAPQSAS